VKGDNASIWRSIYFSPGEVTDNKDYHPGGQTPDVLVT